MLLAYQSVDHYVGYSAAVYKSVAKNEVHKTDLYKYSIKVNVKRATLNTSWHMLGVCRLALTFTYFQLIKNFRQLYK